MYLVRSIRLMIGEQVEELAVKTRMVRLGVTIVCHAVVRNIIGNGFSTNKLLTFLLAKFPNKHNQLAAFGLVC